LLSALPEEARTNGLIEPLLTHAELIAAASEGDSDALVRDVENRPEDLESRLALAGNRLLADDIEAAMTQLLEIVRRDRSFRRGIGRRGLVALFDLVGTQHPLTQRFRRELFELASQ
jgi:putative thioredoxin